MEKDIGKIKKNDDTDIIIRIDDFGGKMGLTIREFVNKSETGYTGFTKSGVRIRADSFDEFKTMINSINPEDFKDELAQDALDTNGCAEWREKEKTPAEDSGIDKEGLM